VIGQKVQIFIGREKFSFLSSLIQLRSFEDGRVVRAARLANADVTEFVVVTGNTQQDDRVPAGRVGVTCPAIARRRNGKMSSSHNTNRVGKQIPEGLQCDNKTKIESLINNLNG